MYTYFLHLPTIAILSFHEGNFELIEVNDRAFMIIFLRIFNCFLGLKTMKLLVNKRLHIKKNIKNKSKNTQTRESRVKKNMI